MQGFLIMLILCSAVMSVLVLFYMAVTPLLAKRYSVTGLYYAWLILVIGLIIPFRPNFGNAVVRIDMPVRTTAPVIQIGNRAPLTVPAPSFLSMPAPAPADAAAPEAFFSAVLNLSWWQIAAVWLTGMILFIVLQIIKHCRFLKLTARWSEDITDRETLALLQNLKTQVGISRKIGLQTCDTIGSPMLTGFVNPRILLPTANFVEDELYFVLKHELVHYKRKDLWYKCLVLAATAIHWFNPVVYLMAKVIAIQCELSCDAEVVRSADSDTRLDYSETIIGVVRYKSKLQTALSTNFYGGKKGMKKRIFSIMDMSKKKAGAAVLSGALILTLGTGVAFASNVESRYREITKDSSITVTPWFSAAFIPSPEVYAPYAAYGITISEDGRELFYNGQPVRMFVDDQADSWAFYMDEAGTGNWSAVRDDNGKLTGVESISPQKAQEYYENFFAEERDPDYLAKVYADAEREVVMEFGQEGLHKYDKYARFGLTCSEDDGILTFNGQRVKFMIDWPAGESPDVLWTDDAGTVNLAAVLDASGEVTGIEIISEEKAGEYQSMVNEYLQKRMIEDERAEAINE